MEEDYNKCVSICQVLYLPTESNFVFDAVGIRWYYKKRLKINLKIEKAKGMGLVSFLTGGEHGIQQSDH